MSNPYLRGYPKDYSWMPIAALVLVGIVALGIMCSCETQPVENKPVTLPTGETVKQYSMWRAGVKHYIYVADGKKVTTDNYHPGKSNKVDTTVEP